VILSKGGWTGVSRPGIEQGIYSTGKSIPLQARTGIFFAASGGSINPFGPLPGVLSIFSMTTFLRHWEDYGTCHIYFLYQTPGRSFASIRNFFRINCSACMPFMFRDWLPSYSDIGGIAAILTGYLVSGFKRQNRFGKGLKH